MIPLEKKITRGKAEDLQERFHRKRSEKKSSVEDHGIDEPHLHYCSESQTDVTKGPEAATTSFCFKIFLMLQMRVMFIL